MSNDDKFIITLASILAGTISVMVLAMYAYNVNVNNTVVQMVNHGTDPLHASCAVDPSHTMCHILAGQVLK